MNNKKLKIAVTGNIGSGKSTFCNYIESKGYKVLRADDIAKVLLVNDEDVKSDIISVFGPETFSGKELNKKFLAEKVFADPQKVQLINSIIHPAVLKNLNEQFKSLLEADMEDFFDYVVLISSELRNRFKRKEKSDKYTFEEFKKREENQIKEEEKSKRADFEFKNNGSIQELEQKAELLLMILKGIAT